MVNLLKIVNQLKQNKNVVAVYLFGSHGTPQQMPLSDIDLCVFTKKMTMDELLKIKSFGSEKVDISLFVHLPIYLKPEVLKGKPLFVRDKYFVAEKLAKAFREYQDFKKYEPRFWEMTKKKALAQ